jgi:Ca2+-binding EF-hand superfamily protein
VQRHHRSQACFECFDVDRSGTIDEKEFIEHIFKNEIYCMEWDNLNELLYCGEKNGQINIWDLKKV